MGVYLRTRGWRLDYRYLGAAPDDFWWRDYRQVTDPERPTILLESDGTSWRMYVAGIASERLDVTDSKIQFTLAADGDCTGPDKAARDLVLGIIALSVADIADHEGKFIDGSRLDKRLPRGEVERMLASTGTTTWEQAADAVKIAFKDVHVRAAGGSQPDGAWVGGAGRPEARDAFIARSAVLLGGRPGRALALNLFSSDSDARQLPVADGDVSVLIVRPGPRFDRDLGRLPPPGALPDSGELPGEGGLPPDPTKPRPPDRRRPGKLATVLSGSAILVVAVIAVLVGQLSPSKTTGSDSSPAPSPAGSHSPVRSPSPSSSPSTSPSPSASTSPSHGQSQPSIGQSSPSHKHRDRRAGQGEGRGKHKPGQTNRGNHQTSHKAKSQAPRAIYRITQGRRLY